MKNYYEILETEPTATHEQIKAQYLLLLDTWNPEKFSDDEAKAKAEAKVKDINEAYSILSDSIKRIQYDIELLRENLHKNTDNLWRLNSELEEQTYRVEHLKQLDNKLEKQYQELIERAQKKGDEFENQRNKLEQRHYELKELAHLNAELERQSQILKEQARNFVGLEQQKMKLAQQYNDLQELEQLESKLEQKLLKHAQREIESEIEQRYQKLKRLEQLEVEIERLYQNLQKKAEVSTDREIKKILSAIRKKYFQISVAHPKYLAKRFESLFLVQIYFDELTADIKERIKAIIGEDSGEHIYATELKSGQSVKIKLYSPDITFSEPIVKKLNSSNNSMSFLGKPSDICQQGEHKIVLSILDSKTDTEYQSEIFSVKVTDFAFDHVSRPLLSKVSAVVLGIGSFSMFILTFLEQIDKTIGLTSGTAVGVLALTAYGVFYNLYQRVQPNTP